ncbi:mycothiol biosynthesis acetyltransferase [Cellulomonas flavigena DSM 20109]|uniref:Mycothiol acetyltransferase n=1 Tax=Cellulomonas flavigena (strain ATCC 482 / DSM 20109 / BCRC 11376 / JCM 18109 / NBRC 3775 / NCIMB 8073 / NRS 134) TaxID=446466 RepID=MSHD_CELFN|nr:mycothiol synthase [Cellulomonas flavigena]D5UJR1.1 RecName: Full=Mycothiol acetyltransferase; Short=MSH acetyltransferase; AltName: Full=Mycothiol synthase [Cellulomonas flavigena DSM 20109]ADG75699.1 mycothiol biosynthesis acetyltransferase [Cellulomonas flavigena DSM 20109]
MSSDIEAPTSLTSMRGALPPAVADDVRALHLTTVRHDGVPPLSEQPLLWLSDQEAPVVHVLAWHAVTGGAQELVGYAQVDVGSSTTARAELVVAPGHRRRGTGRSLLAHAAQEAASIPGRRLHVWAHGDLPAARATAAATGLVVVRELWRMAVDVTQHPPGAPQLPPGVAVRAFVPGQDEDAWRRVNARAFAHHPEQGRMTSADLRARESEPWFDPAGFLLAERDGQLLGSVWTKVHPGSEAPDGAPGEEVGEIYVVGVDPDAQGLGMGRALTALGLAHLRDRGLRTVILYTGAENTVAVHTYRRAGFARTAVDVMYGPPPAGSPAHGTPLVRVTDTPSSPGDATMGS